MNYIIYIYLTKMKLYHCEHCDTIFRRYSIFQKHIHTIQEIDMIDTRSKKRENTSNKRQLLYTHERHYKTPFKKQKQKQIQNL